MDVVEESNGTTGGDTLLKEVQSGVGLSRSVVLPVKGVDIGTDDMVAKGLHDGEGVGGVAEVRRSHVGRVLSDDLEEVGLETGHLSASLSVADGSEVRVAVTARLLAY